MEHRHLDAEALTAGLPPEWAAEARLALTALQDALTPEDDETPCPVCASVSAVCQHGPVLLGRFADFASGLAQTLAEAGENPVKSDIDTSVERIRGTAPTRRPPPPTTVPINVSD